MKYRLFVPALAMLIISSVFAVAQPGDSAGLWNQVTLYRDAWGVPHVYADNPEALGFAFGYAQAEDHLEPMLFAYRVANGRAAALRGEDWALSDAFSLAMGHARLAEAAFGVVDPFTQALCAGFAQGINAYLAEHPQEAPEWAEGVSPVDILALWHAFLMSMAPLDLPDHWRRPHAIETGSAWAVAPSRSESGNALFAMSPHHFYEGPFRWYEAHLVLGDYDMAGVTLQGIPIMMQGFNGQAAWALTPNWPDFADVFKEVVTPPFRDPRDPRRNNYNFQQAVALEFMANARPYYVRTATGLDERYVPALVTGRGPIFDMGGGDLYAWTIGGYRDFAGLYQLYEMGRAKTMADFQSALLIQQIPCFHITYADANGDIFYLYNAKAGARLLMDKVAEQRAEAGMPELTWQEPVNATYFDWAWGTVVPPGALPYLQNPESGYLQACGNPPWLATDNAQLDQAAWPPWFAQDQDTYRAKRVRRLLRTGKRSFRDMQTMLYDVAVPGAIKLVPLLIAAADAQPGRVRAAHPDLPACIDLLRNWNYQAEPSTDGMTFYHLWWRQLLDEYLPRFGREEALYAALEENSPNAQESMLAAAANAARAMRNEFDFVAIPWGDVHRIRRGQREEPVRGGASGDPIFLTAATAYEDGAWFADYGFAYGMAVELGSNPRVVSVSMFGESDSPESEHFSDQFDLVKERRFKPLYTNHDDVVRQAVRATGRRVLLEPLGAEGRYTVESAARVTVALGTTLDPPAPLPEGLEAFTPYITPGIQPGDVAMRRTIRLCVPPEAAAPESWPALGLYAYEPGLGWYALESTLDFASGCFEASHDTIATYAVLGDPAYIRAPEPVPTEPEQVAPPAPPEPAGHGQVWDAEQQDAPHTFTFEVLDDSSLPENRPSGDPNTLDVPPADLNRKPIFRIERTEGVAPVETRETEPSAEPAAPATTESAPAESVVESVPESPAPAEDRKEEKKDGPRMFNFEVLGEE